MEGISAAFTQHFYTTFDTNRPALVGLYGPDSTINYEGKNAVGPAAIMDIFAVRTVFCLVLFLVGGGLTMARCVVG
jgi:hypothetical protein